MVCGDAGGLSMPAVLNRWQISIAGVCPQMALGLAHRWSVFRIPLTKEFGWSITEVTWKFLISGTGTC
jgi:OFA family oxalate/formate antiporter-like MFS transporter